MIDLVVTEAFAAAFITGVRREYLAPHVEAGGGDEDVRDLVWVSSCRCWVCRKLDGEPTLLAKF